MGCAGRRRDEAGFGASDQGAQPCGAVCLVAIWVGSLLETEVGVERGEAVATRTADVVRMERLDGGDM